MPEARVPPGLQVLFAKVTMFTVTFPLTPAIALFVVWSETKSDIRRMLKYERRKVPRRLAYEHAIGPWYSILVVQTILGIVFSSFFFAFSTGELEATYVHVITTLSALPHFVATNSRQALAALELASSFFGTIKWSRPWSSVSSPHGQAAAGPRVCVSRAQVLVGGGAGVPAHARRHLLGAHEPVPHHRPVQAPPTKLRLGLRGARS